MCRSATYVSGLTSTSRILSRPSVPPRIATLNTLTDLDELRHAEFDHRDLRWRSHADRRAPEASAVGHVDRHTVDPSEAGDYRLLQLDEKVERRHLAAVGVP